MMRTRGLMRVKTSILGGLALIFVAVDGWEKEVIVASAPTTMYTVLGVALALLCALFVAITIRYGLMR